MALCLKVVEDNGFLSSSDMVFNATSGVSAGHALVVLGTFENDCTLVHLIPKANNCAIMLLFVPVVCCNFAQP